jgi:predicted lipid-binding transport protein (Tim44 family)
MLGGFALGGLLGSLLFGGLGGGLGAGLGGFGLLDMLLVAGLVFMAFTFFKRRQAAPAMAGAGGASPW